MADAKVTLTITIRKDLYDKLKKIIACGKVSEFVSKAVEENITKVEEKIINDYKEIAEDKELANEIKSWGAFNQERSKNGKKWE